MRSPWPGIPVIAAEVAATVGLEVNSVSTQLERMCKDGILEKATVSTSVRTAFLVSERFFNIWYLMRHASRRQRNRLRWLTEFLRQFYLTQDSWLTWPRGCSGTSPTEPKGQVHGFHWPWPTLSEAPLTKEPFGTVPRCCSRSIVPRAARTWRKSSTWATCTRLR